MSATSRLTLLTRPIVPHFIIFAILFAFGGNVFAQEAPCLQLRNKQVDFIDLTKTNGDFRCRNLRTRTAPDARDAGIDDFTVAGTIRHEGGVPLSAVTMTLQITNRNVTRTVVTGDDGTYFFGNLQMADEFILTPSKTNYQFTPPSVTYVIVRDVVYNFAAYGPPPVPPVPPANQPTLAWTSFFHNPPPSGFSPAPNADYHAMVALDPAGNVFVAGTSHRESFSQNGNTDITIFKTDPNGNRIWSRAFNGPGNYKDGAIDLKVDAAGNAYVAGFAAVSTTGGTDYDYVVLKYAPNGTLLWSRYYAGPGGFDTPTALAVDAAGNAYVTGYSWGNFANYATVKYDTNGNEAWVRRYAGGFGELATHITVDGAGNVFVTGSSGHSVAGDAEDMLTIKYSAAGEQLWINRYDAPPGSGNDRPEGLEIDQDGNVIVVGLFDNFNSKHTIIQKINGVSGDTMWAETFRAVAAGDLEDEPYAMRLDAQGNIILAGQIRTSSGDEFNVYVAKLNANAVTQWIKVYDGPGNNDYDGDPKLTIDAAGNIYVGITSEGFANYDLQIIKYLPDGEIGWTYRFDNPYHRDDKFIKWIDDNAQSNILVDGDGNVIVAGDSFIPGNATDLAVFKLEPAAAARAVPFDFDGDGKADLSVFRPATGTWYIWKSSDGTFSIMNWGLSGDKIVPADYDGDGRTDLAIYRAGVWWIRNSSNGSVAVHQFGVNSDRPVPADFDNDGRADLGVFRQGIWHQLWSSNNNYKALQFGVSSDIPIPADYETNRRSDVAVYRNGNWYVNYQSGLPTTTFQFGVSTDKPVPADYDGDGRSDYAVYRNGTWYIHQSYSNTYLVLQWGLSGDIPVPADYDGDGKADVAIYRGGVWYILRSSDGGYTITQFGLGSDIPVPSAYRR